ncbi:AAA family ATPase [Massilia sp. CF038]|uniref:ATP-binding protein n=1 Tax=Massilia sp. CF038 TaxID=1881045 RepID=UPI00090F3D92|nr:AAA family ATPase [Massilia sp. CF038]SHH10309.1 AAA ATPase domain-containing protein [Massilia sp. CF038]
METDPALLATPPGIPADGRVLLDAVLLKRLRKGRALSQEALASLCFGRQLCVSIASIKRAEAGKHVLYRTARHLATVFDIDPEQLRCSTAPGAVAPPPTGPLAGLEPALGADHGAARYVIEVHAELAASPDERDTSTLVLRVSQFGGRVSICQDGRLIAVFGLPQAYLSDAERAMRCALELARHPALEGSASVAVQLARWADATEPAAERIRLPLSVKAGEPSIWVAHALALQLRNTFVFAPAPPRAAQYQRFVAMAAGAAGAAGPMIGRYAEMRQFKGVIETLHEFQSGHIIYVRGQAGIGKSRLLQEFADVGRQAGSACHHCAVQDLALHGASATLSQLARTLLGAAGGSAAIDTVIGATVQRLQLAAPTALFLSLLTDASMRSDDMALLAAMSVASRENGMLHALQDLIVGSSISAPLLITVEDIHWGDSALCAALGALITGTRDAPVVWVLSARSECDMLETSLRPYLDELPLSVFELAPLCEREAAVLANQFAAVDQEHQRHCVVLARGNPLFLTQLLTNPGHGLPDSLMHLIQIRMDALNAEHRQALRMAAVIGPRFTLSMLRAALRQSAYLPESAGRHCLVRRCGADSYTFVHDLLRRCIYDAIEPAQRRRLHGTVADLYRDSDSALHAHHLWCANDASAFEVALGALRDNLAARRFGAALDLSARWLPTQATSFALARLHADALHGTGQIADARRAYEQALRLACSAEERIDATVGLARVLNILEMLDEAQHVLEAVLPDALALKSDIALAQLLHLKGNIYFPRGNYVACRHYQEQSVYHARAGKHVETEICALSGMGDSYYAQGDMHHARALYGQCLDIASQQRLLQYDAPNRSALASTLHYLGQSAAADSGAREAAALAKQLGNRRAEIFARMTSGWILLGCGNTDAAQEEVATALDVSRSMGAARFEPFLMESMARISWAQGDSALARRQIQWAADQITPLQLQGFLGAWLLGTLALFSDRPAVRKKALRQGETMLAGDCLAHNSYRFRVAAAEVALLDGDLRAAQRHAGHLSTMNTTGACAWLNHHAALIETYTRWLLTPGDQVRTQLQQLRERALDFGFSHTMPRLHNVLAPL